MNPFLDYVLMSFALGITFLYGCVGEIITEKSGHLNLGIPGIMCIGGACGCWVITLMYDPENLCYFLPGFFVVFFSLIAAILGGALMGALYSFLTVTLKSNQNVTGLTMTIFGAGTANYIMAPFSTGGVSNQYLNAIKYFRFPFSENTSSLHYFGVMFFLAIIISIGASFILSKTKLGLNLRSVGENPATADAVGINVSQYKYLATIIGSAIAALGGLFHIMTFAGDQDAYQHIESLGWLSVALVIFTLWKPVISIIGSFVFGLLYLAGTSIPTLLRIEPPMNATHLIQSIPYVVTIIVLIFTSIRNKKENQPPASLGVNYYREDR